MRGAVYIYNNQRGSQLKGINPWTLVFVIVIISIIGYMFLPDYSKTTPPLSSTGLPGSLPNPNDPNPLNSSSYPLIDSPSSNNTSSNGNETSKLATGNWILYLSNGTLQEFSVSPQDYAFLKELINSDRKGTSTMTVFLIDNGQIREYVVSNEISSIISNLIAIDSRTSNAPSNSTPDTSSDHIPDTSLNPDTSQNPTPDTSSNPIPDTSS